MSASEPQQPDWRDELAEERRGKSEQAIWSLPGLTLAAQAFLFSTGLAKDTTASGRIVVAVVGLATAIATGIVLAHQGARLAVFYRWTRRQETDPEDLVNQLPENAPPLHPIARRAVRWTKGPIEAWIGVLVVLVLADLFVFFDGVFELAGWGDALGPG